MRAASEPSVPEADATFWNIRDIQFHCRIGRTKAWQIVREPEFPPPVEIGSKRLVWPRHEVIAFIERGRSPQRYRLEARQRAGGSPSDSFVVRSVRRRPNRT